MSERDVERANRHDGASVSEPVAERPAMSDYGVDTPDWTPLPWSWAASRLGQGRNYWVVTASASARPHALPVWGVWDHDDLRFAFSCSPRSRKAANVAVNPQATVAVDDTVECVSVEGRAAAVDGDRKELWVERYVTKYSPIAPDLTAEFIRSNLVIELVPDRAFGIIEREEEFATRATRWRFA
ncbi:MAG: pyridoxamine 5'-phosphate oxidase family protein [Ilumatobacteraceae bacterium]